MPKSPLSHQRPQDALPLPHPTVWQQLPEHNASSATTSLPNGSRPWCTAHRARSLAMSEKMRPTHLHRT